MYLSFTLFVLVAEAAELSITVVDTQGQQLEDTVVELIPIKEGRHELNKLMPPTSQYEMRQKNRIFSPFVLAVPQGAKVHFPNLDRTRHHVYSFSPAKEFELKLYIGVTESPIEFDKAGLVAIGCNIHDYMQAYIYVSSSPVFSVSNEVGQIQFSDLVIGEYQLKVWHPWLRTPSVDRMLVVNQGDNQLTINVDVERQQKPTSPPSGFGA
ncbi:methylamine utilization protein [Shewanella aestuarii]|uniref:methylamine utilization protein n=1 Tax=Shewanella aestuarii TaxID=1028752 RepID=UPI003D7732A9